MAKATAIVSFEVDYDDTACTQDEIREKIDELMDTMTTEAWDNCCGGVVGTPGTGPIRIRRKADDLWKEDPAYPRSQWRQEVENDETLLGYWSWVESEKGKD